MAEIHYLNAAEMATSKSHVIQALSILDELSWRARSVHIVAIFCLLYTCLFLPAIN